MTSNSFNTVSSPSGSQKGNKRISGNLMGFDPLQAPPLRQPFKAMMSKGLIKSVSIEYTDTSLSISIKVTQFALQKFPQLKLEESYGPGFIKDLFFDEVKIKNKNRKDILLPSRSLCPNDFNNPTSFPQRINNIINNLGVGLIGRISFKRPTKKVQLGVYINTLDLKDRLRVLTDSKNYLKLLPMIPQIEESYLTILKEYSFRDNTEVIPKMETLSENNSGEDNSEKEDL